MQEKCEADLCFLPEKFFSGPSQTLSSALKDKPVLLAPMAGVSDRAYRLMCRWGGAYLCYTEMVSVAGLHYSTKSWDLVDLTDDEPDIAVQLFGSDLSFFYEACVRLQDYLGSRLALIDINMACPVKKVTKKGEGSALMANPLLAGKIVSVCKKATGDLDITVKIRRGLSPEHETAPEFARAMEASGASAITVHGRYASQAYRGISDRGVINRVASAVSVPVIASGDIFSAKDACLILRDSAASAVMLARGSYGNPWIFFQSISALNNQEPLSPDAYQKMSAFKLHVRLIEALGIHAHSARKLAVWYTRGLPDAKSIRNCAMRCQEPKDFIQLADQIIAANRRGDSL